MYVHASLSQSSLSMPNSEHLSKLCSSHIFLYASCMSVYLLRVRLSPVRRMSTVFPFISFMFLHIVRPSPVPARFLFVRLPPSPVCPSLVCPFVLQDCPSILCMPVYNMYVCSFSVCSTRFCMSAHRLYAHPPLVCPVCPFISCQSL